MMTPPDPLVAPVVGGTPEWAWLVELGGSPTRWWTGRGDEWTIHVDGTPTPRGNEADSAIRFARREDADRAIHWLLDKNLARGCKATEHLWNCDAALVPRPELRACCSCGHSREQHPLVNHCSSCLVPTCRCTMFDARPEPREPEPPQWLPIETAPKDGSYMLLASPAHGRVIGAYVTGDVWHLIGVGAVTGASERPTHWMSLPSPPGTDVAVRPASAPSLEQYRQSFACCEVHTPDLWEGDGTCVICEAVELDNRLKLAVADRNHAVARQAELETRIAELEAASAPSRPLEERSMAESPKLQVFSQAQLAEAVHQALAHELPAGHTSAIVGTVDAQGVQMVIGVQKAVGVGTFTTEFVARHDWTGGNELGARVLYSW